MRIISVLFLGLFDANAAIDLAHAVQGLGLGMIGTFLFTFVAR